MDGHPSSSRKKPVILRSRQVQRIVKIPDRPPRLFPETPSNESRQYIRASRLRTLKRREELHAPTHGLESCGRRKNVYFSVKNLSDAARINGIQTIHHTSGVRFAIPLTMQAHPTRLTDTLPDESSDILNQNEPLPYCPFCHSVVKTWQGFEYHVMKEHLKYRPYRCVHCSKEKFYTEEEGRFHTIQHHPDDDVRIIKTFERKKEQEAKNAFRHLLMMMRDGPSVTVEKIREYQKKAAAEVMKFTWLKFRTPHVVVRQLTTSNATSQTPLNSSQAPLNSSQTSLRTSQAPLRTPHTSLHSSPPALHNILRTVEERFYSDTYFPEYVMGSSPRQFDFNSYVERDDV